MDHPAVLDVREVTLSERGFGPVSFQLLEGELVVLCGLSGSGKSTLCQLICSRREPDRGELSFPCGSRVGYVAHDFENQLLGSTVGEELSIGGRSAGSRRLADAIDVLVRNLEAARPLDPHDLSSAHQQILLLCSLVRSGTGILVLDESLSFLDPFQWREFLAVLKNLCAAGLTCLVVSHQPEILSQADRVLALESGELSFDGPPESLSSELRSQLGLLEESDGATGSMPDHGDAVELTDGGRFHATLSPGEVFVVGGLAGNGKSAVLDALFGLVEGASWSLRGATPTRCLLRQSVGPSFWRASLKDEWRASLGAFSRPERKLEDLLTRSIPEQWWGKSPRQLSNGQLRFFGALCLMAQNPEILFMEHPLLGLDGFLRNGLVQCLRVFLEGGGRVLMTTDNTETLRDFAHSALWLEDGEVVWSGQREEWDWAGLRERVHSKNRFSGQAQRQKTF